MSSGGVDPGLRRRQQNLHCGMFQRTFVIMRNGLIVGLIPCQFETSYLSLRGVPNRGIVRRIRGLVSVDPNPASWRVSGNPGERTDHNLSFLLWRSEMEAEKQAVNLKILSADFTSSLRVTNTNCRPSPSSPHPTISPTGGTTSGADPGPSNNSISHLHHVTAQLPSSIAPAVRFHAVGAIGRIITDN